MHDCKKIIPRKAFFHKLLFGRDRYRIGALDQHGFDGTAAAQSLSIPCENAPDLRLIEHADCGVDHVQTIDHGFVEMINGPVIMKRTAAFILPAAQHGSNGGCRMDGH